MEEKFSFKKGYRARAVFRVCNVIFLIMVMIMMIVPILKIVSDSFDATTSYGMNLIPKQFTTLAYKKIITNTDLYRPFLISIYTTTIGTALSLFLTTLGAYVLIQKDMPGRKLLVWFIFFTMIFEGGLVPTYLTIKSIGLMNTLTAVILIKSIEVYNVVLMKNFFEQIPESLMEAAEIDGCSPMGIFVRVVLPLSKPALASIGLFIAVMYYNEFFNYVIYITDTTKYNFQVKLRELILDSTALTNAQSGEEVVLLKTVQNACVVVAMVPFMIIYPFCQKYFVQGVTMGAVKG